MAALESGLVDTLFSARNCLVLKILTFFGTFATGIRGPKWLPSQTPATPRRLKPLRTDYLPKPLGDLALRHTIERAMEKYRVEAG